MKYLHTFVGNKTTNLVVTTLESQGIDFNIFPVSNYKETYKIEVEEKRHKEAYEIIKECLEEELEKFR